MTSARFITVEGIDGAGKSSHLEFLAGAIRARGAEAVVTREPGGTPLGERLRELVLHEAMEGTTEALVMFAARREHLVRVIEQAGTNFTFNHNEKARLISADERREVLIYWRQQGQRVRRGGVDPDSPALQKAGVICATIAGLLLAFVSYVPLKKEDLEEATITKSSCCKSYYSTSCSSNWKS